MILLSEVRKRARHIAGPVLGACVFSYFAYHAVQGDRQYQLELEYHLQFLKLFRQLLLH